MLHLCKKKKKNQNCGSILFQISILAILACDFQVTYISAITASLNVL